MYSFECFFPPFLFLEFLLFELYHINSYRSSMHLKARTLSISFLFAFEFKSKQEQQLLLLQRWKNNGWVQSCYRTIGKINILVISQKLFHISRTPLIFLLIVELLIQIYKQQYKIIVNFKISNDLFGWSIYIW